MKHQLLILAGAALLAGCGNSDVEPASPAAEAAPKLAVTELAAGSYAVSSGDPADPVTGMYYAAADGTRLLVLNDGGQQAATVARRAAGGDWQATPHPAGGALTLIANNPVPAEALAMAGLAGSYTVRLPGGAAASFSIDDGGTITAGASACKLSGKLGASSLPGALTLSLNASGCGQLPAQSSGYALRDPDYAPAAFRLLSYSGAALSDLWAYAD